MFERIPWTISHRAYEHQRGQIALIILLLMAVGLTLGISLSSRTVVDVSLSRQEQEGGKAFQAAESGIEDALSKDFSQLFSGGQNSYSNQITVGSANVSYSIQQRRTLNTRVDAGGAVQVDTTGAVAGNRVDITWGKGVGCSSSDPTQNASSLLIVIYNLTGTTYTQRTYSYAACSYTNGFATTGVSGNATTGYTVSITLQANDKRVSIHPLAHDAEIIAQGNGWTLPPQYYTITSTAQNTTGNETKAIQVSRTNAATPAVFDYVLYSGGNIVK